jgi:anti-sigma factor RsiW
MGEIIRREDDLVSACERGTVLLGAHVLHALDPDETRDVEEHLVQCAQCRAELAELEQVRALLDEVPREAFLEGPPDDADLLLARTLRQASAETARGTRVRLISGIAAAVAAAAALVGAGVLIGRDAEPDVVAGPPTASSLPTPVEGTRFVSATDPTTGARLTARVEPAAGWVRVNAAVTGVPAGERCRLIVVATDGTREVAGSWLVSEAGAQSGTTLDGSALVAPDDVAAVVVENVEGRQFVSADV